MTERLPPQGVCVKCGAYSWSLGYTCSRPTGRSPAGRPQNCGGLIDSKIGTDDWMACPECAGARCEHCQESGFILQR